MRQAGWLRFVWERLEYLVVVVLLTVLLTAPILLPAYELTSYTERQDLTYQESIAYSLAPTQAAVGFFTPGFFGRGPALHWSLWDRVETPYVGIVTLILAVLGFALASKGTRRRLWPWLVLALFGLLVSLGVYGILHGLLTVTLPGFDQFRAPARAIVLWAFGISVMGAVGADVLAKRWMPVAGSSESGPDARQPRERGVTAFMLVGSIVFVGLVVPILFWALLVTQGDQSAFLHASLAALSAVIAAGFWLATWAVLAGYRTGWFGSLLFGGLLVALLFLELTATGAYTDISSSDPTRGYQHPEIVEFLRADPGIFRIDARTDIDDLWQPDTAALAGLQDVWGIANPLMLRHWNALWEATGGRQTDRYDMLNARYVLVRDGTPLPEGKFELAFDAPGELSIYRNDRALPRAWLVHEVIPVQPGAFDAANLGDLFNEANFEPRTMALVETDDAAIALAPAAGEESVSIRTYASSHMALDVEASAPSLLVLSEVWYPGWRAVINGQSVDVLRANGALRAVPVPAGESTVELRFAPSGWRYGLLAFCVGIVVLVGIVLWGIRQPRRLEWHSDLPGQA